jgi:lysophospholipase L1-like esterase
MITVLFVSAALAFADDAPPAEKPPVREMLPGLHLLEPIWSSPVVHRESVIPLKLTDAGAIEGRLAFEVAEILEIKLANGARALELGRDVKLADDKRTLVFPADTALPVLTTSDLFPPTGTPNSYKHRVGHPEQNLLYAEGHWFHDRQIEVTYRRADRWTGTTPQWEEKALPKTVARLRAGQPLTIGVSGDSITQGLNASGFTNGAPFQPAYSELVAAQLQATFGSEVTLRNRAISGWSIVNGLQDLDKLLEEKPHLIIVAYGMNDVGRRDPEWFRTQVATLIERIHKADQEIEIVLVASMLGNKEWIHTPREMFPKYRAALASLCGPGVALADLTAVWETLLQRKHDLDLIGNGLNHPNDFGHRLYAQAVLSVIVPPRR